jgi:nucleotide-binding universal stress UspA family protein
MSSMTEPRTAEPRAASAPERVVFAVDETHGALAAAGWLAQRALQRPIDIRILVIEDHLRAGRRTGSDGVIAEGVAWEMREYLGVRAPSARTTIRVLRGNLLRELHDAAAQSDLFVLGCNRSRNRFWQHLPIATRSTRIAEDAPAPTVLVPDAWLPSSGPVVAGVAATGSEPVVGWAAAEAAATGRPLLLLRSSVLPWSIDMPAFPAQDIALLDDFDRRLLRTAAQSARAAHPGLEVRTELDHGGTVHELVAHGALAGMLVLGTARGAQALSPLRGVLEKAPCPVVVVPTEP